MYSSAESLYYTPETNIILDVNWNLNKTSLKKEAIVHLIMVVSARSYVPMEEHCPLF